MYVCSSKIQKTLNSAFRVGPRIFRCCVSLLPSQVFSDNTDALGTSTSTFKDSKDGHQRVTPEDPRVQQAAEREKAAGAQVSELCALCCDSKHAPRQNYCNACRRKVDACRRMQKSISQESLTYFNEVEAKRDDRTALRVLILQWEDSTGKCGQAGGRAQPRRAQYDLLVYKEHLEMSK